MGVVSGAPVVVRKASVVVAGVVFSVLVAVVGIGILVDPSSPLRVGVVLIVGPFVTVVLWFLWSVALARVVVSGDGLAVRQLFSRWVVPWASVRQVRTGSTLTIVLTDGRQLTPAVGQEAVLGPLLTDRRPRRTTTAGTPGTAGTAGAVVRRGPAIAYVPIAAGLAWTVVALLLAR